MLKFNLHVQYEVFKKWADTYSGSIVLLNSNSLETCESIMKERQIQNLKNSDVKLPVRIETEEQ